MRIRKRFEWRLKQQSLLLGERTLIMGVLNVTPDSFSDGGQFLDPEKALAHAIQMEEEGADIIDVGGESTRPGAKRVPEDEEWRRVAPVLKRLRGKLGIPVSIDTYKSDVAARAIELGAEIVNDPSGLTFDPAMPKTVLEGDAGLIVNHMRGTPESWMKLPPLPDVMGTVMHDLEASLHRVMRAGVHRRRLVADPGLGFGKRKEQNSAILGNLGMMAKLEVPIMVGPSRKSFLADADPDRTEFATAAAVTAAILNGAHIVRVHSVKQISAAVAVADQILRETSE